MRYRVFGHDGDRWIIYYYFIQWSHVSLGLHVDFSVPNVEVHLPFGFIRVGRKTPDANSKAVWAAMRGNSA